MLTGAAIYIVLVSLVGAVFMLVDKRRAVRKKTYRISERKLLITAAAGAALLMWFTAYLIRHKTMKPKFRFSFPFLSVLHVTVAITIYLSR